MNMSCEEFLMNRSLRMKLMNISLADDTFMDHLEHVINSILIPIVCTFGLIGNMLNLAVLTRKQLRSSMDRLEKTAHLGLVALAISDFLFCLCTIPLAFLDQRKILYFPTDSQFLMYYKYAQSTILNTLSNCSTWLTVVMAMARYLAICHPLHARSLIHLKATKISISMVFIVSILFNIPWLLQLNINSHRCAYDCVCYSLMYSSLYVDTVFEYVYSIIWAILSVFIPVIILTFCNICLIVALRQSFNMQKKYRVNRPKQDSGHNITPILITIVILFLTLVVPSEVIKFLMFIFEHHKSGALAMAALVTNFLQVCNFAVNFILYCVLNVHFRQTINYIVCCKWQDKPALQPRKKSTQHTMTSLIETDI